MTAAEREILHHRIKKALLWVNATEDQRLYATRLATTVLDEMERSATSAATQRRAVQNIVARIEERKSA